MTLYTQSTGHHFATRRNSSSSPYAIPARPRSNSTTSPYSIPDRIHGTGAPHSHSSYNARFQYHPANPNQIPPNGQISNNPSQATANGKPHPQGSDSIPLLTREFVVRRISEGETGRVKQELKCEACGKGYKHISSLAKHLWEHTAEWNYTKKLLISKHQQVQLLEAASILVSMNENDKLKKQSVSSKGATSPTLAEDVHNNNNNNNNSDNHRLVSPTPVPIQSPSHYSSLNSNPSSYTGGPTILPGSSFKKNTEFNDELMSPPTNLRSSFNYHKPLISNLTSQNNTNGGYLDAPMSRHDRFLSPNADHDSHNNNAIEDDDEDDSRSNNKSPNSGDEQKQLEHGHQEEEEEYDGDEGVFGDLE
ncbi:hypothetical protein DASC09_053620 [Saccharomycopsis crataegensis]|uniref:C2H2-type domain-containing protein n=1 Tax=Saccharomycopsis crataegensis TaxID=43959 RepID=A0AAV5QT37_9ASCO|nr:hypothetical protein DASC09_053620 [Saccharomycopsis crataegensis]